MAVQIKPAKKASLPILFIHSTIFGDYFICLKTKFANVLLQLKGCSEL